MKTLRDRQTSAQGHSSSMESSYSQAFPPSYKQETEAPTGEDSCPGLMARAPAPSLFILFPLGWCLELPDRPLPAPIQASQPQCLGAGTAPPSASLSAWGNPRGSYHWPWGQHGRHSGTFLQSQHRSQQMPASPQHLDPGLTCSHLSQPTAPFDGRSLGRPGPGSTDQTPQAGRGRE